MLSTRLLRNAARELWLAMGVPVALGLICLCLHSCSPSESAIRARRERIEAEITQLGSMHPWAGTYYRGDGLGCNNLLTIAPREGYQFTNHGCLGLYDADHGSATLSDGRLVLWASVLSSPLQRREFVVVDWGSRRYLLEPSQLLDFVNAVNQDTRESYRTGLLEDRSFYLRIADREKELEGKPALPPEYARLLLADRIEGHVSAVKDQHVDLDLGLDRGVFEGMKLILLGEGDKGYGTVVVSEVAAHSSVGLVNYMDSFSPPVAVGWIAVSRLGD